MKRLRELQGQKRQKAISKIKKASSGVRKLFLRQGFTMKYDAIIFDLDGTLWDSTKTVAGSWSETLKREGVARRFTAGDIAGIMGCTDREIEDRLFTPFKERAHELCVKCMGEEPDYVAVHGGRIYKGVESMLEALSGILPLFIVSNC